MRWLGEDGDLGGRRFGSSCIAAGVVKGRDL